MLPAAVVGGGFGAGPEGRVLGGRCRAGDGEEKAFKFWAQRPGSRKWDVMWNSKSGIQGAVQGAVGSEIRIAGSGQTPERGGRMTGPGGGVY